MCFRHFSTFDGIKIIFDTSAWCLLRVSNTSPCLVVRCEADTQRELDDVKAFMLRQIKEFYLFENV